MGYVKNIDRESAEVRLTVSNKKTAVSDRVNRQINPTYTQVTSRCSVQREWLGSQSRQRLEDLVILNQKSLTKAVSQANSPFGSVAQALFQRQITWKELAIPLRYLLCE